VVAADTIDTTFVLPDADFLVAFRPAQFMASPNSAMYPLEVFSALGLKYLGMDPAGIDEVVAFIKQPANLEPPQYAITIKFSKPFSGANIPQELRTHTQRGEMNGHPYLQSQDPMKPSFYSPDGRILLLAPEMTLRRLLENKEPSQAGRLVTRVRSLPGGSDLYVGVDLVSLRPLIQGGLAMAQMQAGADIPPQAQRFFQAPGL